MAFPVLVSIEEAWNVASKMAAHAWTGLQKGYSTVKNPIDDHNHRRIIEQAFGIGKDIDIHVGRRQADFPEGPRPDNMDTCKGILSAISQVGVKWRTHIVTGSCEKSVYVIGGPTSSLPTRNILGVYEESRLKIPGGEPPIKYHWYFTTPSPSHTFTRYIDGRLEERRVCQIVDSVGKTITTPIPVHEGRQNGDWLMVIRTPNLITPEAFKKGSEILFICGLHGVGTKAFPEIISKEGYKTYLDQIVKMTTRSADNRYYQALFSIGRVDHKDDERQSLPEEITLFGIESLEIDPERINRWFSTRNVEHW
jgi:hypothetical protein